MRLIKSGTSNLAAVENDVLYVVRRLHGCNYAPGNFDTSAIHSARILRNGMCRRDDFRG